MKFYLTNTEQGKIPEKVKMSIKLGDPALADENHKPITINLETGELSGTPTYKVYDDHRLTETDKAELEKTITIDKVE